MEQFLAWLTKLFDSWKLWIIIAPWEIGVRIRIGRKAAALRPGPHFRIPFIDAITLVNTRLRIEGAPPVTIAGKSFGHTRYISASVGFRVVDPVRAMLNFGMPGSAVTARAQVETAASQVESEVLEAMRSYFSAENGIAIDFVRFVEDVEVKTFRLINQASYINPSHEAIGPNARY